MIFPIVVPPFNHGMSSPWQQAVEIMETDALPLVIDADYVAARFPPQASLTHIFPWRLTWNPKMEVWKMNFLFNWVILFRFHVNFPGCTLGRYLFRVPCTNSFWGWEFSFFFFGFGLGKSGGKIIPCKSSTNWPEAGLEKNLHSNLQYAAWDMFPKRWWKGRELLKKMVWNI